MVNRIRMRNRSRRHRHGAILFAAAALIPAIAMADDGFGVPVSVVAGYSVPAGEPADIGASVTRHDDNAGKPSGRDRLARIKRWDYEITRAAAVHKIDRTLLEAVVLAESAGNPDAVSPKGAVGLGQLMPGTARALAVDDPRDPLENVDAAAYYLRAALDRFQDVRMALAAYNAGPEAVERYGGIPPYKETRAYVDRVLELMAAIAGKSGKPAEPPRTGEIVQAADMGVTYIEP